MNLCLDSDSLHYEINWTHTPSASGSTKGPAFIQDPAFIVVIMLVPLATK